MGHAHGARVLPGATARDFQSRENENARDGDREREYVRAHVHDSGELSRARAPAPYLAGPNILPAAYPSRRRPRHLPWSPIFRCVPPRKSLVSRRLPTPPLFVPALEAGLLHPPE